MILCFTFHFSLFTFKIMERALFIAKQKNLKYLTADYQRVYFGNEFCERLLPGPETLSR